MCHLVFFNVCSEYFVKGPCGCQYSDLCLEHTYIKSFFSFLLEVFMIDKVFSLFSLSPSFQV